MSSMSKKFLCREPPGTAAVIRKFPNVLGSWLRALSFSKNFLRSRPSRIFSNNCPLPMLLPTFGPHSTNVYLKHTSLHTYTHHSHILIHIPYTLTHTHTFFPTHLHTHILPCTFPTHLHRYTHSSLHIPYTLTHILLHILYKQCRRISDLLRTNRYGSIWRGKPRLDETFPSLVPAIHSM